MTPLAVIATVLGYSRTFCRRLALGPACRQCRVLHRQPEHAVVYGSLRHDWGCNLGRDFHLGAGFGRRRFLLLHADGRRFHRGAAGRRVPAHPDLLPPPGGVALRIPRRALRHPRTIPGRGSSSCRRCWVPRCVSTWSAPSCNCWVSATTGCRSGSMRW